MTDKAVAPPWLAQLNPTNTPTKHPASALPAVAEPVQGVASTPAPEPAADNTPGNLSFVDFNALFPSASVAEPQEEKEFQGFGFSAAIDKEPSVVREFPETEEHAAPWEITPVAPILHPFMPTDEALLPQPKMVSNKPWIQEMTLGESALYDNHIQLILQNNPMHAGHLLQLKGFVSPHVGFIRTIELAERHIMQCLKEGTEIGQNVDYAKNTLTPIVKKLVRETARMQAKEYQARLIQHRLVCRDAWKEAIRVRQETLDELNARVRQTNEEYCIAREMTIEQFMEKIGVK